MKILNLTDTVTIDGKDVKIRADFRDIINILVAFEDENLTDYEKMYVIVTIFYKEPMPLTEETFAAFNDFVSCGSEMTQKSEYKIFSWSKDMRHIISGIDKTLGKSCRNMKFLHWWDFMNAFNDMNDCFFTHIIDLRSRFHRGKLTKEEKNYWYNNESMLVVDNGEDEFFDSIKADGWNV